MNTKKTKALFTILFMIIIPFSITIKNKAHAKKLEQVHLNDEWLDEQMFDMIYKRNRKGLLEIINKGANVNAIDGSMGLSPLNIAIFIDDLQMVQALLEVKGVDINSKDFQGNTPLHNAVLWGHMEVVKIFIQDKRAKINEVNNEKRTPLHLAAFWGYTDFVDLLLQAEGILIDEMDGEGKTPLMLSRQNSHTEIVEAIKRKKNKDHSIIRRIIYLIGEDY